MKKRLVCLFLALTLCLTSVQALAVKRNPGDSGLETNSITPWGSFNNREDLLNFTPEEGVVLSYVEDGANNTKGAMKLDVPAWCCAYITVPYIEGETYDITFYAKIDSGTDSLRFIPMLTGYHDETILIDTYTPGWKKYTCSYVCDGKDAAGNANVSDIKLFNVRCGAGDTDKTYYLDEISVVPRGDGEFDWNTYSAGVSLDYIPADTGFASPMPEQEVSFADTKGHWAENTVNLLAANNLIAGMGDGTFAPQSNVTRAQFVKMAMNLLRLDTSAYKEAYNDVKASDWFAGDVQNAKDLNFISPVMTFGGIFKPNQAITREEAATILAKMAALRAAKPEGAATNFKDASSIADWAKNAVDDAVAYGLIKGYPNGNFAPANNITRAEAATMIFRIAEIGGRFAVYVDADNGNDKNTGTVDAPLATIDAARKMIRPFLDDMKNHIYVYIKGRHFIDEAIEWTVEDSGENGYSVIYTSYGDEMATITSGKEYRNFVLHDAEKNIYKTFVGVGVNSRQVFVNGVRGIRARTEQCIDETGMLKNATLDKNEGYYLCTNRELLECENQTDMELVYFESWTNPRVHVKSVKETDDGMVKLQMNTTSWKSGLNSQNCPTTFPVYIENAYAFLDGDGEWYVNKNDGYLYYKPRANEDPKTMVATIPVSERGMTITGDSADNKIHNLKFRNLEIKEFTWLYPSTDPASYRDNQSNYLNLYKGDGRLTGGKDDAAIVVADAAYIDFEDCKISQLGGGAIDFREIFQHCNVTGNHIYDISGSGVFFGVPNTENPDHKSSGDQYNKYTNPKDYKNFRIFNTIKNNYIHDFGLEYGSSVGVNTAWLKNSEISYNEMYNTSYSGITTGYGWAMYENVGTGVRNMKVLYNYVHDVMNNYIYDGAGIYLLGATGGSETNYNETAYNYIENVRNAYCGVYADNGSTYWEIHDNVVDFNDVTVHKLKGNGSRKPNGYFVNDNSINNYLHDNYATINNDIEAHPDKNIHEEPIVCEPGQWTPEAWDIIENAGLTEAYLAKYPDSIQRIKIQNELERYYIRSGDTVQLDVVGYMRRTNKVSIPNSEISYYSTDENVAVVDKNGLITGTGYGDCCIYAEYMDGDIIRRDYIDIVCDDRVKEVVSSMTAINVLQGIGAELSPRGKTESGNFAPIDHVVYTVEDPTIARISDTGRVEGLKMGKTNIHAVYTVVGQVFEVTYPVSVVSYARVDTLDLLGTDIKFTSPGSGLLSPDNWTAGATANASGGVDISYPTPCYYTEIPGDQLLSFDLTIENPNSWPSLALRAQDPTLDYSKTDTYLMGFKTDHIELQRFNSGNRTMIFGDQSYTPIGGPGYPNLNGDGNAMYQYGKKFSVTVGALDEDNGVRLVLIINGKPIYDFLDTADGNLGGKPGYFGIYAYKGRFIVEPYSGITIE